VSASDPLRVEGELTVQVAAEYKAVLLAALGESVGGLPASGDEVAVDLSGVSELDTAGLQLLLMLKREADLLGKSLRLNDPSQAVLEVLGLARLDLSLTAIGGRS
jgi:ABC-type transporter Mla MlaB component